LGAAARRWLIDVTSRVREYPALSSPRTECLLSDSHGLSDDTKSAIRFRGI